MMRAGSAPRRIKAAYAKIPALTWTVASTGSAMHRPDPASASLVMWGRAVVPGMATCSRTVWRLGRTHLIVSSTPAKSMIWSMARHPKVVGMRRSVLSSHAGTTINSPMIAAALHWMEQETPHVGRVTRAIQAVSVSRQLTAWVHGVSVEATVPASIRCRLRPREVGLRALQLMEQNKAVPRASASVISVSRALGRVLGLLSLQMLMRVQSEV
jgi:hypothetical protein